MIGKQYTKLISDKVKDAETGEWKDFNPTKLNYFDIFDHSNSEVIDMGDKIFVMTYGLEKQMTGVWFKGILE